MSNTSKAYKAYISPVGAAYDALGVWTRPDWYKADRAQAEAARILADVEPVESYLSHARAKYLGLSRMPQAQEVAGALLDSLAAFVADGAVQ